ncbi:MAG TPA: hypothetical protein VK745_13065 [Polyangiaceae bacterium]|jgi:hypothetical protein|nr:hypothetical protein [Polyangiaceae bacterium]
MALYLHVRITVKADQVAAFIKAARKFLETRFLPKQKWELIAAFQATGANYFGDLAERSNAAREKHPLEVTFINVWRMSDIVDLSEIMLELSEFGPYIDLDARVTDESQDVALRVIDSDSNGDAELIKKVKAARCCAMVRHYVDRANLAEFVVNFGALVPSWEHGLVYCGTYQNVTGLLNEFWDVWIVEPALDLAAFRAKLSALVVAGGKDAVTQAFRHSIDFDKDGPDDGIVMVEPAEYWTKP